MAYPFFLLSTEKCITNVVNENEFIMSKSSNGSKSRSDIYCQDCACFVNTQY